MGAFLQHFPMPKDTARHIFRPYEHIPTQMAPSQCTYFRLVEQVFTEENPLASVYQTNMLLLRETRQVEIKAAREGEARR